MALKMQWHSSARSSMRRFNVKRGTGIEDAKRPIAFRKGYLDTKLKDSFEVSNLTKGTSRIHS
jgi:hypothetical protein